MADLTDELKLEIVTRLARFEAPADIMTDLKARGIECERGQIGSYDPTRPYFEAGARWVPIFEAARKVYLEDVAAVPIAHRGYRLNELHKLFTKAVKEDKPSLAIQIAEQASKEVGGAYTNQRELNVHDPRQRAVRDMPLEDKKALMADLIRQTLEAMTPEASEPQHPTPQ